MKIFFSSILIIAGICVLLFGVFGIESDEKTIIEVSNSILDVGNILQTSSKEAKGDFVITNIGRKVLFIDSIETDCNCTSFRLIRDSILPNNSVIVSLVFDKSMSGYFSRYGEIYCNSDKSPLMITIIGHVIPPTASLCDSLLNASLSRPHLDQ